MNGIIYKATNKVTGKVYIGQTTQSLKKRIIDHKNRANDITYNYYFYNSLRQYGFNSFSWEVVGETYDIDVLNALEAFYIDLYDSKNREKGYNIRNGGSNGKHVEETIQKISKAMKGRKHSEESKEKMSKAQRSKRKKNYRYDLNNDEIIELYKKGKSLRGIGKKLNAYPSVIKYRLQQNGIKLRNEKKSRNNGLRIYLHKK